MAPERGHGDDDQALQASETLQMVELVAGGIAHDFNNLLQTILSRVELTQRAGGLSERQAQHLHGVLECTREAQALAAQLKLLARGGAPQRRRVDLGTLAEQAIARCLTDESRIAHSLNVHPDARHAVLDPAQLGQVFDNLLHNARQALHDGGHVSIDISRLNATDTDATDTDATDTDATDTDTDTTDTGATGIDITRTGVEGTALGLARGNYICVRVQDNGPGIPADALAHIFEPDFTTKAGGSGIGLAICRGVARRHGGQLTCRSSPGKGTTFTLLLPPEGVDSTPPNPPR